MIPRPMRQPDRQSDAIQVSGGSKVAAGPSTCGDWIVAPHHRTRGEPGQGVDVRLLRPVANNPGPDPPSGGLFAIGCGCGETSLVAVNACVFQTTDHPSRKKPKPDRPRQQTPERFCQSSDFPRFPPCTRPPRTCAPTAASSPMGGHGTPTTRALQDVLMSLEGPQCAGVGRVSSGLSARSPPPCSRC